MKYFLEIGSCFFNTLSHLTKSGEYKGILIEPIKKYYDRIQSNKDIYIVNTAISTDGGKLEFYCAKDSFIEKTMDIDYCGMSTVRPHMNGISNWSKDKYELIEVNSITFDELMNSYFYLFFGEVEIDILKIDIEGYDLELIQSIDFSKYIINTIIVEYIHCGYNEIAEVLTANGFVITMYDKENIYANRK